MEGHTFCLSVLQAKLNESGYVLLRHPSAANESALVEFGESLGTLDVGISEELLGPRVMDLRFDAEKAAAHQRPAYFNANHFPLHTDVSYVPNPPRFMLLHCVHPDPAGGGAILLADCDTAAPLLSPSDRSALQGNEFRFSNPPNCPKGVSGPFAIKTAGLWRFKPGSMFYPESLSAAVDNFYSALESVSVQLQMAKDDLLIVDNHRMAHGRTAFSPTEDGRPGRHIRRLYVNE